MCTVSYILPQPSWLIYTAHTFRRLCDFSALTQIRRTDIVCCQNANGMAAKNPPHPPWQKTHAPCVPPTIRFDPRVMHCGRKWTPPPLPHVFAVHRHNDNNSCDSTRRRPLLCSTSWYTEREWQVWKIGKQCLLEGFLGAWVPFEIMCECRGVWMKNSCVILPCCFCQERVIFYLSFPLSLLLPPSLPQLAVILICPSKLTSFSSSPFSPLSLRFSSSLF